MTTPARGRAITLNDIVGAMAFAAMGVSVVATAARMIGEVSGVGLRPSWSVVLEMVVFVLVGGGVGAAVAAVVWRQDDDDPAEVELSDTSEEVRDGRWRRVFYLTGWIAIGSYVGLHVLDLVLVTPGQHVDLAMWQQVLAGVVGAVAGFVIAGPYLLDRSRVRQLA